MGELKNDALNLLTLLSNACDVEFEDEELAVDIIIEALAQYRLNKTNTGVSLIAKERKRQIDEEGWSSKHDDKHIWDELALAAAVYAIPRNHRTIIAGSRGESNIQRALWPFEFHFFKPSTHSDHIPRAEERIKELKKAGALIAAEIDRIIRANGGE